MSANPSVPRRELRAEAAAWLAKLHGSERSDGLENDFRCWLKADPQHAAAFEHITEIWDAVGQVNTGGIPRPLGIRLERSRSLIRGARLALVVSCILLILGSVIAYRGYTAPTYSTDIGEQRSVTLDDGSRLSLNSGTRIDVEFTEQARLIQLERGEAYFEVGKDPARPFIVKAGDKTILALGTTFSVRREVNRLSVTLIDGKVSVTSDAGKSGDEEPTILIPGQRLTFPARVVVGGPVIDSPRPDTATAWLRGEVILDNTPLGDAVDEMNRYERRRLILDDTTVTALPVSGIYRTGDSESFARAVGNVYGLEIRVTGKDIHLSKR